MGAHMFKKKVKPVVKAKEKSQKAQEPTPTHSYHKHSARVKQRAFELYMDIDQFEMTRRYTMEQVAAEIKKEFKNNPEEDVTRVNKNLVAYWVKQYGWAGNYATAIERGKAMADDTITHSAAYQKIASEMRANTVPVDTLMREIDKKVAVSQHIDRLAPVVSTIIADLFILNQTHFKNLMLRTPLTDKNGKQVGQGYIYEVGKNGERKQLFDMWMEGTNKLLDIYNLTPPKKTNVKGKLTNTENGQEIDIDSTTSGGVNLSGDNYELILKLFGIEQTKGGFGNELNGPNNADFPGKQGTAEHVEPSETGADS